MHFSNSITLFALIVSSSAAYQGRSEHYGRRAGIARSEDLFGRASHDHLLQMRSIAANDESFDLDARDLDAPSHVWAVRRFEPHTSYSHYARSPVAAGGKGGGSGGKPKSKGNGPGGNCRQACKFCKDKKGADGKPCSYHDVQAPPGVDKKRFDKCKEQLAQNAGVNPGGMGAVSAGSGLGGSMATVIVGSINDKLTSGTCAGVGDKIRDAVSSGGGQCC